MCLQNLGGGGSRGAGAREIRWREAGEERAGSRSSKRARSGEKCEMLIILIQQCLRLLSKTSTQIIFNLHLMSFQSPFDTLSKTFALGLKNRLTSGEIVHLFTVVTSYRS